MQKTLTETPNEAGILTARQMAARSANPSTESESNSTLIEFPGSRSVPEWRKRLSKRVREVQEQKAREAAEADAALRDAETVSCSLPSGQLELVPERDQAPLNPIVTKALERVDRARRAEHLSTGFRSTAAAAALAPIDEEVAPELSEPIESKPKLTIVTPVSAPESLEFTAEEKTEATVVSEAEELSDRPKRSGVISPRVEEAALSYLENCLSVPAHLSDTRKDMASVTRRIVVGVIDLVLIALMVSPAAAAIQNAAAWSDPRVASLMAGITVLAMFAYFTIAVALTGRTLGMRLLSVRTIDARTGLIPTGGQSIKRALGYIFSLAVFGLGLAFALIDREHRTLHDRFSKTIVVRA
jgi:uncharacterized RDD family membrane protein YckC